MILIEIASGLLTVAAIIYFVIIVKDNYYRVPLLSFSQGDEEVKGKVTRIKKIAKDVLEVRVEQGADVDPSAIAGNVVSMSVSIGHFIHFRLGQKIPAKGELISAKTTNVLHRFTGRSLNWVNSWNSVDSVPSGAKVTRA